jgi:hypothetical protein
LLARPTLFAYPNIIPVALLLHLQLTLLSDRYPSYPRPVVFITSIQSTLYAPFWAYPSFQQFELELLANSFLTILSISRKTIFWKLYNISLTMKTAAISLLFAGLALAIPAVQQQKRAIHTDVVIETVWTTTTMYVDATGAAKPNFFEKPSAAASVVVPSAAPAAPSAAAVVAAAPSVAPAPAPVAAPVAAAPVVAAPATGSGPSGTGEATWYDVTVGKGSCGAAQAGANDAVVALAIPVMANGANPNNNPLCGKTITITYQGATHQGVVYDTCAGCAAGNIDLSAGFFKTVFPAGDGRVSGVSWVVG